MFDAFALNASAAAKAVATADVVKDSAEVRAVFAAPAASNAEVFDSAADPSPRFPRAAETFGKSDKSFSACKEPAAPPAPLLKAFQSAALR